MCLGYYTMSPSEAGWLRRYQHALFYHNSIVITIIYSKKNGYQQKCLHLAEKKKFKSVAFPLISTGFYGFPKQIGVQTAIKVLSSFLLYSEMMVYLVVYDEERTTMCWEKR